MISIIIPYFKTEKFIEKAIKSVLSQSYKNWELIIIDDENSIKSKKTLSKFKRQNIKILTNKKNIGVASSRNKGIKIAKGQYIAFLDSDDWWSSNKLRFQIKLLKQKNVKATYTSYQAVKNGKILYTVKSKKILNFQDIVKANPICCSSVIIEKNLLLKNKFNNLRTKEDYELWLRISKKIPFYPLNKRLTNYRVRDNSLSSLQINKIINAFKIFRFYNNYDFIVSIYFVLRLYINAIIKKLLN